MLYFMVAIFGYVLVFMTWILEKFFEILNFENFRILKIFRNFLKNDFSFNLQVVKLSACCEEGFYIHALIL